MIIQNVNISGFEAIYYGIQNCEKENRTGFGTDLVKFLNHCMISLNLTDLSTMEVFYLKQMATNISIIMSEYKNFVNKKENPEIHDKINEMLEIHNSLQNDSDIDKNKCDIDKILPIGCKSHTVVAIFKGSNILSITGTILQNLFKDESGKFEEIYCEDFVLKDRIAKLFFTSFYTFISDQITSFDIVTEFVMNNKFYKFGDSLCTLATISSQYGEIRFFNNTQERLQREILLLRKSMMQYPYSIKNGILLNFVMNTSVSTFLHYYFQENSPVVAYSNLKLIYIDNDIHVEDSIIEKYRVRINSSFEEIAKFKAKLNSVGSIDLNKFNYIFPGNRILYTVQWPLSHIQNIENTLDRNEIKQIDMEMNKIVKTVQSILS